MDSQAQQKPEEGSEKKVDIKWPLSYRMRIPKGQAPPLWWSHELYRGPENATVEVFYSKDKARSEIIAKKFLGEPVVGFDMEWPWDSDKRHRLQEKIGLIQVASEDKIALFHIGLHHGKTSDEIIAPSLKQLIESPTIAKTGVNVLGADFSRLTKFFGLKPRGAFELSHLHRLVMFGAAPALLTTRLVKLADQVKEHLGYPLSKGGVRTSNWSKALNEKQIKYAASDAYAGFMLFHQMNAKRMALRPTPPLPIFAEDYRTTAWKKGSTADLRLYPLEGATDIVIAKEFFAPKKEEGEEEDVEKGNKGGGEGEEEQGAAGPHVAAVEPSAEKVAPSQGPRKEARKKKTSSEEPLDATSRLLYQELASRRLALARAEGLPAFRIASNTLLERVAQRRPVNDEELLEVKGIGEFHRGKYGAEWLEVIAHFLAANKQQIDESPAEPLKEYTHPPPPPPPPTTPYREARRRRTEPEANPASSATSNASFHTAPQLHTGLSFTLADTALDDEEDASPGGVLLPPAFDSCFSNPTETGGPAPSSRNIINQAADTNDGSLTTSMAPPEPPSLLKRKREAGVDTLETDPTDSVPMPVPVTPRSKIFRNQLVAFSKLVSRRLNRDPAAEPLVGEAALDETVANPPRTIEALHSIPGMEKFDQACREAGLDLLRNITKFAPAKY